ncbi:cytochrome b-c1 complex subunit 9-like [Paramacrobiotus metropolitanus]|uniref:cytochrome b-c1 complex subunit 9-like n=1 Tax=Paramacrobiotus metropolitanus TaxID=2943436 RepID=UPI002445EA0F|nr:cytochrome b-c1 complex subunit 9-like [Paramacrobiotus metropolitanus]
MTDILQGKPGQKVYNISSNIRDRFKGTGDLIYRNVFRRTSTFVLAIALGAFFFERAFDKTGNEIFERWNKGKLWKDIRHNYEGKTPAVEEEEAPEESE